MNPTAVGRNPAATHRALEAGAMVFRRAALADDAALRQLLQSNVMESWVHLTLEREPDYFAAEGLIGDAVTVIAEQRDAPHATVGMYTCNALPVHYQGAPVRACYLGGLRVNPAFRKRIRILRSGFESIHRAVPEAAALPVWFTSIASENTEARRVLEARLPGMPVYTPIGELETLALSTRAGRARGLLRPAQSADIPAMVALFNHAAKCYEYSPVLSEAWLRSLDGSNGLALDDFLVVPNGGQVSAMVALWDQRRIKQTVARGYRFPLNLLRGGYNVLSALTGGITLPQSGRQLEQVYLAFAAFAEAGMAADVLREALVRTREHAATAGVIGCSVTNPLLATIKREFRTHSYRSYIEAVAWDADVSALSSARPAQPEVAIL